MLAKWLVHSRSTKTRRTKSARPYQACSARHSSRHRAVTSHINTNKRSVSLFKPYLKRSRVRFKCVSFFYLGHQPSSKLASLASLQLTPTLTETKRKLIHSLKSTRTASIASESTSTLNGNHLLRQQTCSSINPHQIYSAMMSNQMTTSSLLSLDTCIEDKIMPPPPPMQHHHHHHLVENKPIGGGKVILKQRLI